MNDVAAVAVLKGFSNDPNNFIDGGLISNFFSDISFVDVLAIHILHDDVVCILVVVHLVQFYNIFMFQLHHSRTTLNRISVYL